MPAPSSFRGAARRPRGASSEDWGPRSTPDGRAGSVRDGEKTPAASSSRGRRGCGGGLPPGRRISASSPAPAHRSAKDSSWGGVAGRSARGGVAGLMTGSGPA